jgi:hypothetical protein
MCVYVYKALLYKYTYQSSDCDPVSMKVVPNCGQAGAGTVAFRLLYTPLNGTGA